MDNIGQPGHDILRRRYSNNRSIILNSNIEFTALGVCEGYDLFGYAVRELPSLSIQFLKFNIQVLSHASFSPFSPFSLSY